MVSVVRDLATEAFGSFANLANLPLPVCLRCKLFLNLNKTLGCDSSGYRMLRLCRGRAYGLRSAKPINKACRKLSSPRRCFTTAGMVGVIQLPETLPRIGVQNE